MPLTMGAHVVFGMRSFASFVASLVLPLMLSGVAHAQAHNVVQSVWARAGVTYQTQNELCAAAMTPGSTDTLDGYELRGDAPGRALDCYLRNASNSRVLFAGGEERCPAGSVADYSAGHAHCHSTGNQCTPLQGQQSIVNMTVGWARSNDPNSPLTVATPPGTGNICNDQCAMAYITPVSAWHSQHTHSNGMHRVSLDVRYEYTGEQCAGGTTPAANPQTPEPPCPGITGQVDGRPVCFGTAANPLPSTPTPAGMPPAAPGNPAAGPAPTSGQGSGNTGPGRTPTTGNGGNGGGGSNASTPGGGSDGNGQGTGTPQGTNPDGSGSGTGTQNGNGEGEGEGLDPCGLPNTPPCRIDESGMPTGAGVFTDAITGMNQARQDAIDQINAAAGTAGKNTGWTFSFQFPTGCSPIPLGGFAPYLDGIDVCQWQGEIHAIMKMIWILATIVGVSLMVRTTLAGS